jgi:quercetin dioxygenase-like cupin family protein
LSKKRDYIDEIADVVDLADLVEYNTNSVVSKTVVEKDTGTITLFAFDKGQGLSEHTVQYDALVYIFDGKAQITVGDETHILKKGQLLMMPANIPHALTALEKYKMMLIMIKSQ